jgi:hypothetical protein
MTDNFDWKFYINFHTDLRELNLDTKEKAFEHWLNNGIYEERLIRRYSNFEWEFYINHYPDLLENNINNEALAKNHWNIHGKNEHRVCNPSLLISDALLEPEIKDYQTLYMANSYINNYCKIFSPHGRPFYEKKNYLDIDLYFYKKGNNINLVLGNDLLRHFHENYNGLIYHPKQLLNIYKDIKLIKTKDNILVEYQNNNFMLYDFLNNFIYNKDFNYFSNFLLQNVVYNLKSSSLLLLVFIGDYNIGINLINKIINYKNFEKFNIAICFNNQENCDLLKSMIINNFKYYAIYVSSEFGNDITPTLLMYNNIKEKKHHYKYIIKLQTKSNGNIFNELTDHLLTKKLKDLLLGFKQYSNCINRNDYYLRIVNDQFNRTLIDKYKDYIDFNKSFIIGTIFYSKSIIFDKVLEFMINNYKQCLFNNMYDSNCTLFNESYVHFLERLFGVIKYK